MNRLKKWQVIVFISSFMCMASRHSALTGYFMVVHIQVKHQVQQELGFSNTWLGVFDSSYLLCYAFGNFVSGVLGDKYPLKNLVSIGMLLFSIVYGIVRTIQIVLMGMLNVTIPWIYAVLFAFNGAFQSTVWPGTVAVIANWFPKSSRGSVMGFWSTNASVGDIIGQQTAAFLMGTSFFRWEFVILITIFYNLISGAMFLFVEDKPDSDMLPTKQAREVVGEIQENSSPTVETVPKKKGISFWKAWLLPGVLVYSLNYGCVKLLNYGMIMWLPFFISTQIGLSAMMMGVLTSTFDIGGVIGSIISGWISDRVGSRTVVMVPMLMLSVPVFLMFRLGTRETYLIFFVLTPICGFLVGGASNIISSAVAADLAQNEEVQNDHEALATVTGIIDGTGGVGAALGLVVIGYLSEISWNLTFGFLMVVAIVSFLLLVPMCIKEYRKLKISRQYSPDELNKE